MTMEAGSGASYYDRDTWEECGSHSSFSHQEEPTVTSSSGGTGVAVAGIRAVSGEPPRSTAYYYAELERFKRKEGCVRAEPPLQNPSELSEYGESNEVVNDGAIQEVPPFRDRQRSLPEYSTPENRKEETYSTAGTFPMPEPKEKEPLLAELEIVGRLPLTQLDSSGVRRSRSWYLCCPNVEEEMSRESSWRYSSLRPVTAPPAPGQNGITTVSSQGSGSGGGLEQEVVRLRSEREALQRLLAAERARAGGAARAHDARLAELHGVIAELVRRRADDKRAAAIPEEELSVSDECESTTQPAGELGDDAPGAATDQNSSSGVSPEPQTPEEKREDTSDTSTREVDRTEGGVEAACEGDSEPGDTSTSLRLSERDSELCLNTARCCQAARSHLSADTCGRERGSPDELRLYTSPGRLSRQAKLASRVRLQRTREARPGSDTDEQVWWAAAERLALDVCAQADTSEALAGTDESAEVWRLRCLRVAAECRVLRGGLARAAESARRVAAWRARQESACVCVCAALRAADRAIETYDVLLALAEAPPGEPRAQAEAVAAQLLHALEGDERGGPLLPAGPWLGPRPARAAPWGPGEEARLRAHAAALKADTVSLRHAAHQPNMFSYYDAEEEELSSSMNSVSMAEMEAALMMQEVFSEREAQAAARARGDLLKSESTRSRPRDRHWLDTRASETDL